MAFTLSDLLQETYKRLGQWNESKVTSTGASATILQDSVLANEGADDDWKSGAIFMVYDAGGANAAPEGEFSRISAYTDSSGKFTFDALSTTVVAPDRFGYVSELYPLQTMIGLANASMRSLGTIPLISTALQSTVTTLEYGLPPALKRNPPSRVDIRRSINVSTTIDYQWDTIERGSWEYVPATAGSSASLQFKYYLPTGRKLRVWYEGPHPYIQASTDVIYEGIEPDLATLVLVERALEWQNSRLQGGDQFLLQRWNDSKVQAQQARVTYRIWKPKRKSKFMITDKREGDHLPYPPPYGPS